MATLTDEQRLTRWRLMLGKDAEKAGLQLGDPAGGSGGEGESGKLDRTLGYLYGEKGNPGREESSGLSVPHWLADVEALFPRQAKEVMEKELIKRKGIDKLLEHPNLLEKIEADVDLVKTLLTHKNLLTPKTRVLARKVIDKVVNELKKRLETQVEQVLSGALRRDRHSPRRVFRNMDLKMTVRRNMKNWDEARQKLLVDKVFFYAAERTKRPWHIIVCVDQSGSMMESTIFSAVMASIFAELPAMRTSLVLYDTRLVDLSQQLGSPVDTLLSAQLGGGNDTPLALRYCQKLIREPARTILVLISDFYEGAGEDDMVRLLAGMGDAGVRAIGLAALGYDAAPSYNKPCVARLRKVGMDVLSCTPEKLVECMAQIIRT
jgi:hypothetical protein